MCAYLFVSLQAPALARAPVDPAASAPPHRRFGRLVRAYEHLSPAAPNMTNVGLVYYYDASIRPALVRMPASTGCDLRLLPKREQQGGISQTSSRHGAVAPAAAWDGLRARGRDSGPQSAPRAPHVPGT